ncbi:MAG: hypothetical protein QXI19_03410 [Candidatus Caldarchaeum sp.]
MKCPICGKRKSKRYCPAKGEMICPVCCGEKRGIEISCPSDCPYFAQGQRYQEEKVTRQRISKEGVGAYVRRSELYNRNPRIFHYIEIAMAELCRQESGIQNRDVVEALELVERTLDTRKSGIIYEHRSQNAIANELSRRVLEAIREAERGLEGRARLTVDFEKEAIKEFKNEVRFYMETDTNPRSYVNHILRYHPSRQKASTASGIIILPK